MANDWTRLLQEAAKRRGPEGLRTHYRVNGQLEGIGYVALGLGLSVAYRKTREHFAKPTTASPRVPFPRRRPKAPAGTGDADGLDDQETPRG